jgi:hypothetical protein|eukprot:COSAG06_NODE_4905_length_3870_cov_2.133121_3_plen_171_part_00
MDLLSFSFLTLPSEAPDLCDDKLLARAEFQQVSCTFSVHDVNPCAWILDKADLTPLVTGSAAICEIHSITPSTAPVRMMPALLTIFEYNEKVTAANVAMKPGEHCEGGRPNVCNTGCSRVMQAMERACADYSASHSGLSLLRTTVEAAAARCRTILGQLLKVIAVCCLGD